MSSLPGLLPGPLSTTKTVVTHALQTALCQEHKALHEETARTTAARPKPIFTRTVKKSMYVLEVFDPAAFTASWPFCM